MKLLVNDVMNIIKRNTASRAQQQSLKNRNRCMDLNENNDFAVNATIKPVSPINC